MSEWITLIELLAGSDTVRMLVLGSGLWGIAAAIRARREPDELEDLEARVGALEDKANSTWEDDAADYLTDQAARR